MKKINLRVGKDGDNSIKERKSRKTKEEEKEAKRGRKRINYNNLSIIYCI
jgi:hypothetical protein